MIPKGERPYIPPLPIKNLIKCVYQLCSIRGAETIVKLFPHDVEDLELLIELLENLGFSTEESQN